MQSHHQFYRQSSLLLYLEIKVNVTQTHYKSIRYTQCDKERTSNSYTGSNQEFVTSVAILTYHSDNSLEISSNQVDKPVVRPIIYLNTTRFLDEGACSSQFLMKEQLHYNF